MMVSQAPAADLRCDMVGVAQLIVPDLFDSNPTAQKLGLKVTDVRLGGLMPDGSCLVKVTTNHGEIFKYLFRIDNDGHATLDMVP